nr:hypothetical protein [Mycoplasma phocoeninasale]
MNLNDCLVLQNGKVAEFVNNELVSQKHSIRLVCDVVIDGLGIGDISHEVINERENLSRDGVLAISSLIDFKTKQPINDLQIASYGILTKENKDIVNKIVNDLFYKEFADKTPQEIKLKEIQEKLRKTIKRKTSKMINKEPIVVITLYEI